MLKNNILANLLGNGLVAVVSIVSIPIYVFYLGVEPFGLIGIFASFQVIFSVLDAGLSATLNREFARLSVTKDGAMEQQNLLRTFEYIYIGVALLIGTIITFCAPIISKHWLSGDSLTTDTIQYVLVQMGVLLAFRWPTALYAGGLAGLQKQVLYNMINTTGEIVKAAGAIFVLAFISNNVISFFYWQIIITALNLVVLHVVTWKNIPEAGLSPTFSRKLLLKNRKFATGMGGTSLIVILLTQTDKIVLSKLLDLKTFAYFTLASAIASSLFRVILPVSQAVYPRMVQLIHNQKESELIRLFHMSCQVIAAIALPFALTIAFFSREVIMLWTHDQVVTEAVHPLVRVLIIGTACNALVTVPYMVQLAYGWTKLGLYQNLIAFIILLPSIIYLTNLYGAYGAVWCWTVLNASYILFSMPVMFSRYLSSERWQWYWTGIIKPAFFTVLILVAGRLILNFTGIQNNIFQALYIGFLGVLCSLAILYLTPSVRNKILLFLNYSDKSF